MRAATLLLALVHAAPTGGCGSSRVSSPASGPTRTDAGTKATSPSMTHDDPDPTPAAPATMAEPAPAPPRLEQRIRDALPPLAERPVADPTPRPVGNAWVTPAGAPITHTFELEWSRPKEQDGWPTTVFYSEPEGTYWLHEGFLRGGLSTQRVWYGPFSLAPAP